MTNSIPAPGSDIQGRERQPRRLAMPLQRPGSSRQDYGTPSDLIRAVELKFGSLSWDIAASPENAKAPNFITADTDSLDVEWHRLSGLLWLNPPFRRISPWVRKCLAEARLGARVLLLTPASVGSFWHQDYIHDEAAVYFLRGRLVFQGTPSDYPKDCMISAFGMGQPGYDVWDWRATLKLAEAAA